VSLGASSYGITWPLKWAQSDTERFQIIYAKYKYRAKITSQLWPS